LDAPHVHPNGEVCNCKEKMFQIKRDLRVKHLQHRKTLKQSGVLIQKQEEPSSPALDDKNRKPSEKMKD